MRGMFDSSQFNQEINGWDVSKVTSMGHMVWNPHDVFVLFLCVRWSHQSVAPLLLVS